MVGMNYFLIQLPYDHEDPTYYLYTKPVRNSYTSNAIFGA